MVSAEPVPDAPEVWDWEIVEGDWWWKTSFRAISWAYRTKPDLPRPPHYHDLLARGRRRRIAGVGQRAAGGPLADVSLNTGLCGVRAAEEALKRYELDVAILPQSPLLQSSELVFPSSEPVVENTVWDDAVKDLLGGILEEHSLPEVDSLSPDIPLWDLDHLDSLTAPSSVSGSDLADSESSLDFGPLPRTPKPTKASALSYAGAVSGLSTSPVVVSPLPSRLLSKDALDFIPATPQHTATREPTTPPLTSSSGSSDSPYSSPAYNFHFPSLNEVSPTDRKEARSLPNPDMQKDTDGFWFDASAHFADSAPAITQSLSPTRTGTPRRPSAALLPSFLTDASPTSRSRNSRTREIVDRLRSSGNTGGNRKAKKGGRRHPSAKESDLSAFVSDVATKGEDHADAWISTVAAAQASPSPPSHHKHHKHGHKRYSASSGSTTASISPPSSASAFSPASSTVSLMPQTPATVPAQLPPMTPMYSPPMPYAPYGPHGPYAPANHAYMHVPYPSARAPWAMGYQPGMYPVYQPFGVMPAVAYGVVPVAPLHPAFYDGKGKPAGNAMV